MFQRIAARFTINAAIVALLVGALAWQTVRIEGFKIWPISHKGLKAELAEVSEKLRHISDKRDEQSRRTEKTIENTRIIYRDADRRAGEVEQSVPPGNCEQPQAVRDAEW